MKKALILPALFFVLCTAVWAGGFDVELLPGSDFSLTLGITSGELEIASNGDNTFESALSLDMVYGNRKAHYDMQAASNFRVDINYDSSEHDAFFSTDIIDGMVFGQNLSGYYYIGQSSLSPRLGLAVNFQYEDASYYTGVVPYFGAGRLLNASDYVKTYLAVKGLGVEYLPRSTYTRIAGFSARKEEFINPFSWAEDMESYRFIERSIPGLFGSIDVKYMLDSIVSTRGIYKGFQVGMYPNFWFATNEDGDWNAGASLVYLEAILSGPLSPTFWYRGAVTLYDDSLDAFGNTFSQMVSEIPGSWFSLDAVNVKAEIGASWFLSQRFRLDYKLDAAFLDVFSQGISDFSVENFVEASYKFASHTTGFFNVSALATGESLTENIQANWGISLKIL